MINAKEITITFVNTFIFHLNCKNKKKTPVEVLDKHKAAVGSATHAHALSTLCESKNINRSSVEDIEFSMSSDLVGMTGLEPATSS